MKGREFFRAGLAKLRTDTREAVKVEASPFSEAELNTLQASLNALLKARCEGPSGLFREIHSGTGSRKIRHVSGEPRTRTLMSQVADDIETNMKLTRELLQKSPATETRRGALAELFNCLNELLFDHLKSQKTVTKRIPYLSDAYIAAAKSIQDTQGRLGMTPITELSDVEAPATYSV